MATSVNGSGSSVSAIIGRAQALFDDLSFTTARAWKAASPDRKVIGYLPIYVPRELIHLDGMLFPSICDVIRNLSGMWKMMFPKVYVRYFDVPQNYKDEIGGNYYTQE